MDETVVGVTPDALRHAMSQFAAGVTIVTAVLDGIPHALTATAFSSVSLDPPLCLVCVGKSSRFHAAIIGARRWAVSILAQDQEPIARHFAHRGRDLLTQFDHVPHRPAPNCGAPLIEGATTWLECVTSAEHEAGDHTVVIGEIVWVADATADALPLTHYRGNYHHLGRPTAGPRRDTDPDDRDRRPDLPPRV
ncbi:MAG TPA: flavin reductase family protein [Microlunatus sp.]|nr:flavin reductase family protein [Microlunatus sp.]